MGDKSVNQPPGYDEVNAICKEVLEEVVGQGGYQHTEAVKVVLKSSCAQLGGHDVALLSVKWNQTAVEQVTERLVSLNRPYKYCVCCIIMQTGLGAGLNVASTCYWDKLSDCAYPIRWESKAVIAVCNVFALALNYAPPQSAVQTHQHNGSVVKK